MSTNRYAVELIDAPCKDHERRVVYGPFPTTDAAREFGRRSVLQSQTVLEKDSRYQIHMLVPYVDPIDDKLNAEMKAQEVAA